MVVYHTGQNKTKQKNIEEEIEKSEKLEVEERGYKVLFSGHYEADGIMDSEQLLLAAQDQAS